MDKKNVILGIGFLIAAFAYQFYTGSKTLQEAQNAPVIQETAIESEKTPESIDNSVKNSQDKVTETLAKIADLKIEETLPSIPEQTTVIGNEFIEVVFTNWGGAIKEFRLLKYQKENVNTEFLEDGTRNVYVINEHIDKPALALELTATGFTKSTLPYQLVSSDNREIVFERRSGNIAVRRTYKVAQEGDDHDPYEILHKSEIINLSSDPVIAGEAIFNVGTSRPVDSDKIGQYLTAGYYNGIETNIFGRPKALFTGIGKFKGSNGILGIGARGPIEKDIQTGPIVWSSVKNQFFTSVLTPKEPAKTGYSQIMELEGVDDKGLPKAGVNAHIEFGVDTLKAQETKNLEMSLYVGPKEFRRLDRMGHRQDLVMQFGFFGFFSKVLLGFMQFIQHHIISNWGVAIIIMTICIKLVFWPLTAKASKSQKGMQKIQAPLQEIRAKYKDNPKKLQQETVKLFKENGVNPAAGCLPILIQIPIFLGLFGMLRTASELRFADFLWMTDLSQADTVAIIPVLGGLPLNIMPLIMGVTMVFQMRMMPTPTPPAGGNNEMAEMQQKMFKFMPFIMLIFLYNFSSGLVIYWTVQNLLTILQQAITNRQKDDAPIVVPETAKKGTKKVAAKKKK